MQGKFKQQRKINESSEIPATFKQKNSICSLNAIE